MKEVQFDGMSSTALCKRKSRKVVILPDKELSNLSLLPKSVSAVFKHQLAHSSSMSESSEFRAAPQAKEHELRVTAAPCPY